MSENQTMDAAEASRAFFEQAQEAMLSMFRMAPGPDPEKTVETVTEKVVESQRRAFEMMKGMAEVWTDLARRGADPDAWKRVLDETTQMMRQVSGPVPEDARKAYELWREQGERMLASFGSVGSFGGPFADAARSLFPGGVPAREGMTALLSSPGFGLTREYQAKMGQLFETWLELQQKEQAYRSQLAEAWTEAFRDMAEAMVEMTRSGKRFEHPREMMDKWVQVADRVFTKRFALEAFTRAQAEMLNAAHRFRRQRRDITEDLLRAQDLPTRADLDEAHHHIYRLRKELRGLQRELAALRAEKEGAS